MPRFALLFTAFLVFSPLGAAEIVTPERPVADLRLAADAGTWCSVVSGDTKAYAICGLYSGNRYRIDLGRDGTPLLSTRVPFCGPTSLWTMAGDALYYTDTTENAIFVWRFGGDGEARIDGTGAKDARLTWNGGSLFLLTYTNVQTLMGAIVDTALHVVVAPFPIMPATPAWQMAIASAGGGFMIVTRDTARVSAALVDARGTVHTLAPPAPSVASSLLASNGSEYVYVWQRDRTPITLQRYSPSGDKIGDLEVVADNASGRVIASSVVWTGSDYLIGWIDGDVSWMRTLGGAPQLLGEGTPNLVAGRAGVYLTMSHAYYPPAPERIRRLDTNDAERTLSYGPLYQSYPAMAMNGGESAVVWLEDNQVRFARVRADGTHPDGAGTPLPIGNNKNPALASDGFNYFAAWIDKPHVYGLFVSRDGRVAGAPFVIGDENNDTQGAPAVTWSGTSYLVTWSHSSVGVGAGAAVTPSGSVAPFQYGGNGSAPSVSAGPRTLVVYQTFEEIPYSKIRGVFLDAAGSPFDIVRELQAGEWRYLADPRVVTNGRDFLLTWILNTTSKHEAWMARVDDRGRTIGNPLRIASTDDANARLFAIPIVDGAGYRVAIGGDAAMPLFVARVTDATFACLCLDDRVPIPVTAAARPLAAAAWGDVVAVSYVRADKYDVQRVFVRFVFTPPPRRRATR
jgi:hypothetical protein